MRLDHAKMKIAVCLGLATLCAGRAAAQTGSNQRHLMAIPAIYQPADQTEPTSTQQTDHQLAPYSDPRVELRQLLTKVGLGSLLATAVAGAIVFYGGRRYKSAVEKGKLIWVKDTVGVGAKCRVAVVQFGERELLVGHDHTGLRSLVLVPTDFRDELSSAELPEAPQCHPQCHPQRLQ